MNDEERSDRYRVPDNAETQYADADERVLVNKKGVTDLEAIQILEEEALAKAYESLVSEVRVDTPMTNALLRHIHERIFGDLYEWAGRYRSVQISKPGAIWPPPQFLDQAMDEFEREVLQRFPASALADDTSFCTATATIQGEFLAIHPFREGNARAIKLMTDLLALQTGRPFLRYDASTSGQEQYIAAAKVALARKDYEPMITVIDGALQRARQHPSE